MIRKIRPQDLPMQNEMDDIILLNQSCNSVTKWDKTKSCLNNFFNDDGGQVEQNCFPYDERFSIPFGIWMVIISVVGCFGNLLTILALGYGIRRKL